MTLRPSVRMAALAACALAAAALGARAATGQDRATGWEGCGSLECRTLAVPLDYDAPAKGSLAIRVARVPARDEDRRLGSLVVNPGGPGGSGIAILRVIRELLPDELLERFDIVSFDPRGVGRSEGLDCALAADDIYALDAAGRSVSPAELDRRLGLIVAPCLARNRTTLPHLGTANAARDLDRVRALVGDQRLTYLGWSYGTILGAVYAELFPGRVRAAVLDGAAPANAGWREVSTRQAAALERSLKRYVAWCIRVSCKLEQPERSWRTAVARLRRAPLRLDGRPLYVGHLVSAAYASLGSGEYGYPELTAVLRGVLAGEGARLAEAADALGTPEETGALYAISCADTRERPSSAAVLALSRALAKTQPLVGWGLASGCPPSWPLPADPMPVVDGSGSPPIVVVGTTGDPATPYVWAQRVARELDSGVLLTYRGLTHTAFPSGSPCLDGTIVRYLVEARAPAPRTCG